MTSRLCVYLLIYLFIGLESFTYWRILVFAAEMQRFLRYGTRILKQYLDKPAASKR